MINDIFRDAALLPSNENIINAFKRDSLNRVDYVFSMYGMINRPSFDISSISLDGDWGSGKTFFVKMLIMLIMSQTKNSDIEEDHRNFLKSISEKHHLDINEESFVLPVYYDAWENDSMSEPILSLVYSICKQNDVSNILNSDLEKNVVSIVKAITKVSFKTISLIPTCPDFSDLVDPVSDLFKIDSAFVPVVDTENLKENIRKLLKRIVEIKKKPLVVFIDELDRCRPQYAIKLLESIKHFFNNEKVLFVFSVNTKELQHSIKCIYGQEFDAIRYIDRFFDIRFTLPLVDVKTFLDKEYPQKEIGGEIGSVIYGLSSIYNMQMRDIAKFNAQVRYVVSCQGNSHEGSAYDKGYTFTNKFFVPIAICLKYKDPSEFQLFMSGKGEKILKELLKHGIVCQMCMRYLGHIGKNLSS